jgi:hypothetical protein
MSAQQGYERYMPGDVVRMQIHIRHRPMHLWAMEAVFLHSGGEEELQAEVDDLRTNSKRAALPGGGIGHESVADLSVPIRRGTPLGVYRLVEVAVQTYGGPHVRLHRPGGGRPGESRLRVGRGAGGEARPGGARLSPLRGAVAAGVYSPTFREEGSEVRRFLGTPTAHNAIRCGSAN